MPRHKTPSSPKPITLLPASATAAFMKGDVYGSFVRGGSQELLKYVDNAWNAALLFVSHPANAPSNPEMDQEFLNDMPFASPMKNWLNVDYGDNSVGNSFVTTFAPLTQNAMNSLGVGQTTTETPTFEVQTEPATTWQDYLPTANAILNDTKAQYGNVDAYGMASPNAAARNAVQGSYVDPFSNQKIITGDPLAADHIYPQVLIKQMPGFDQLTPGQQDEVLNNPANFQGLPQTFNSSKNGQPPGDWVTYKGQPLDPGYIQRNQLLQHQLQIQLQEQINGFIQQNRQNSQNP